MSHGELSIKILNHVPSANYSNYISRYPLGGSQNQDTIRWSENEILVLVFKWMASYLFITSSSSRSVFSCCAHIISSCSQMPNMFYWNSSRDFPGLNIQVLEGQNPRVAWHDRISFKLVYKIFCEESVDWNLGLQIERESAICHNARKHSQLVIYIILKCFVN